MKIAPVRILDGVTSAWDAAQGALSGQGRLPGARRWVWLPHALDGVERGALAPDRHPAPPPIDGVEVYRWP